MITIKDIAKQAGVSPMTVSNVINGNKHKVSEQTYRKIMELVNELDYVPNANARSLSKNESKIIALYIPSYQGKSLLDDSYNSYITGAVENYIQELGYSLMLVSKSNVHEAIELLLGWKVDGIIGLSVHDEDVKILEERISIPVVLLDSYYSSPRFPTVGTDDFEGGWLAGKYLVSKGHRKVAFASGPETLILDKLKENTLLWQRYKGFSSALSEGNIPANQISLFGEDISYEGGIRIGLEITQHPDVTAIFCTADILAVGIMEGLRRKGREVPKDLSIVGFDDLPISQYVTPKLTTIKQKNREKGAQAADVLLTLLEDGKPLKQKMQFGTELVERQSVRSLLD